jgi:5-aminopentanamidase
MDPTRLVLHAATPRLGDVDANVAAVAKAVSAAKAPLVAFPEMFLSGYNIGDDAQRLALTLDDERLEPLRKACRKAKANCVVGGPRKVRAGVTANAAFLVRPDGTTEAYDKRVLANYTTFEEGKYFRPGRTTPVWDLGFAKVGVSICYDLFFPEFQRRQALDGADLLLNVSASPTTSQRFFEALFPARAIENACFVAYTNLAGPQDGIVFWGGAQAWTPRAHCLGRSEPMRAGKLAVALDWDDLAPAREFRPTLRDVRSEDLGDLGA